MAGCTLWHQLPFHSITPKGDYRITWDQPRECAVHHLVRIEANLEFRLKYTFSCDIW